MVTNFKGFLLIAIYLSSFSFSYSRSNDEKAIQFVRKDVIKNYSGEFPRLKGYLSANQPETLTTNLTGGDQDDLVVMVNYGYSSHSFGVIYVFKFEKNKIKLIYRKNSWEVEAEIVECGGRRFLLAVLADDDGGEVYYHADLLFYRNKGFSSVLEYPYSCYVVHGRDLFKTQLIPSGDAIRVIQYEWADPPQDCVDASLIEYKWDERKSRFLKHNKTYFKEKALDDFLLRNNAEKIEGIPSICDGSENEGE